MHECMRVHVWPYDSLEGHTDTCVHSCMPLLVHLYLKENVAHQAVELRHDEALLRHVLMSTQRPHGIPLQHENVIPCSFGGQIISLIPNDLLVRALQLHRGCTTQFILSELIWE